MISIQRGFLENRTIEKTRNKISLFAKYMDYVERQNELRVFWFMLVIISIPCVFMVLSIFAMAMLTPHYLWFVGLSMLLFFANVVTYIGPGRSNLYVPLYHGTVALFILIPFITYLLIA